MKQPNVLTYAIWLASSCNICSLQRRPFLSSVVSKRALKNMIWYKLMLLIKFFHLKPSLCNATTIVGRSQECCSTCSNVLHLSHFKAHFSLLKKSKYFVVKTFHEKSSNKLRMKALVGWNILFQVPKLINMIVFFTRIKNDLDKEDKIAWDLNWLIWA